MVRDPCSDGTGATAPGVGRRRLLGSAAVATLLGGLAAPARAAPAITDPPPAAPDGAVLARGLRRSLFPSGPATNLGAPAQAARLAETSRPTPPRLVTPRPTPPRPVTPRPVMPRLVMLDPGHGGKDPGAIGLSGTYEKHVALAAARELKRQLEAGGQYRVELTRHDDLFIPLEHRVAIAQSRGAALFVSIHADALLDHEVRGASVYTLADTASDAQTAALARRENSADRFAGPGLRNTSPEVAAILASLVQQETRAGSARLAHDMVDALDQDLPMLQNPSRHAGFVVLKAADIPSVLVEMGFMSNRSDEAALREANHRAMVAGAMKRAVDTWFAAADRATHLAG